MHLKLSWVSTHLAWMEQGLGLQKFCSVELYNKRIITQDTNILTKACMFQIVLMEKFCWHVIYDETKILTEKKIEKSLFAWFITSK